MINIDSITETVAAKFDLSEDTAKELVNFVVSKVKDQLPGGIGEKLGDLGAGGGFAAAAGKASEMLSGLTGKN